MRGIPAAQRDLGRNHPMAMDLRRASEKAEVGVQTLTKRFPYAGTHCDSAGHGENWAVPERITAY